MIMQTIADYLSRTESNTPFWGSADKPAPIIAADFQSMLTAFMDEMYGTYRLRFKFEPLIDGALTSAIQKACDNVYLTHAYLYQTLYDTTVAEYNPIENYDMTEHEETVNSGTDETTHDLGSHTDNTNYGESTVTDIYGNRQKSTESTGKVAPFESQSYQNVDNGFVDETQQSATDRHTQSQRSDSTTYGGRVNTDSLEHGHEITRDLTRHGNIGVTTTQQMLMQEREVARLNLVRVVANDIVHALCLCYRGGC